ncbi:hypothetical protein [Xanthobacter aminoxidans]|uniref:hypothetical protein n=1 Tax=Xanthobacter aminoxidans TaxID=186280 RepID=UPI002022FC50|nr:hypothetical protein [Xanthobacter aminoxidans]MCL8383041.1 hypothetical protein [Xanthobacter aminoxidans]
MARIFAFLVVFISLLGAAPWLVPVAKESAKLIAARDDPAALADLGLRAFTGEDAARAIAAALAEDDTALATSYLALADARHLAVPPELRKQVEAANGTTAQALHSAKAFGMGFITGQPNDLAGLAGAATSDLMVWGDIRDAGREGLKMARGEEPDQLILGLSAVGIAVTAGTYATVGASLPVRMGISLVKVAKRTGRLSAGLLRSFTRAARESVDFVALRRLLSGSAAVDGAAVKSVVRTDRLATLTRMLDDTARIEAKAGTRAALEGLKVAEGGRDLSRVARLADAKGAQTLAILKTLGRGAIAITSLLFHLIWWGFLAVFYLFALVSSFNSFCVACARRTWRHKRRRREAPRGAARGKLFVRRAPVVAPMAEVAVPATAAADVIAEATRDVLAATEAVRALGQEETGGELAGGEGPSSFPARAPERRAAPLLAVPREGPSCPISPPTVSISPISIRVPASRSS